MKKAPSTQRSANRLPPTPPALIATVLPGIVYQVINYPDKSQKCLYVNDAIRSVVGITPKAFMKSVGVFRRLIHPADLERIDQAAAVHSRTLKPWAQQYRLIVPNRGTIWVQSVAHLERLVDHSIMWTGFVTDITAIKRAEEALQISEERIALAARAGKVGLWDYDFITHGIIWNQTQYEIHGVHPDSYTPNLRNNSRFLHPDSRARVEAAFNQCIQSGSHEYQVECQIIRADGEIRTTRSSAFIIRNEKGEPIRAVGTEVDITEEVRLMETLAAAREAAEAVNRTKSDFLARMSHEIRTPMNAMVAPAELLAASDLSPTQQELAAMIVNAGEHLLQIVNDILDFSKLEAGKMKLSSEKFSLITLVDETIGLMQILAEKKGITLRAKVSKASGGTWIGDANRIKQVLFNLLSNAIKFTNIGEVYLTVSSRRKRKDEGEISFVVRDTGMGFSEEDHALLFQPFEQARSRPPADRTGTGLGLSICRELVQLMGGAIDASSTLGVGSVFEFTIPLISCAEPPFSSPVRPAPRISRDTPLHHARILIVEDNAANRRVMSMILNRLGYQNDYAINGVDAVKKQERGRFDLILMDFEMPEMNGIAATREIRRLESKSKHTPIVGLTAHVSPEHQEACRKVGMDAVLFKPIIMADLKAVLKSLVD